MHSTWIHTNTPDVTPRQRYGEDGHNKRVVTIRLDTDTLAWFKAQGPGYQTRINALLRAHMEAQQDALRQPT